MPGTIKDEWKAETSIEICRKESVEEGVSGILSS